ncbi:tetratricopeptide repeat-containing sensor histidine kinase [Mangrovimonas spongiae]|uniref:histidine kinase n=1 Tax=Mangrovimonas spongiae TaxID=2494697 RepID=A0A3R9MRQ3_9FLAO|nr:sensor histidine kinase [Mangrovimonas spongiae]RSK39080.1 two-component sensor histidine kinase [Mangrovimonas spongiae]
MKSFLFLVCCVLSTFKGVSQHSTYIDSIQKSIKTLSKQEQLQHITAIPYDKYVGNVKASEAMFLKAIDLALRANDSMSLSDVYFKLGQIYAYKEQLEKRTDYVLKSIKIYELLGEHVKAGVSYGQLGYNLKYGDMDNALRYMRKGIKLLEQNHNKTKIDPLYDNYGIMLTINKKYDSALYYTQKSLKLKKVLQDSVGMGFGYANVATVYAEINKFNLAKQYIDSSTAIRTKIKDNYGIAVNYTHLADVLYKQNLFEEAIKNYQTSAALAKKGGYKRLERYCYETISKAYVALNNYKEAYFFANKYQVLKDSVLNVETNNKVEQLKIEFETEKKEKEILSQRADLAEKELDLSQKNNYILILVALAIVLVLLGYFVYSQQKIKNKQLIRENQLKDALTKIETQNRLQEQRLQISRDLHDNIGAQLTFIISSLDNIKYGFKLPENLDSKLKNISAFTSATIYELRDTIWAMNKNAISLEDLQSRISNFIDKAHIASEGITFNFENDKSINDNIEFTSVNGMNIYRIIQEAVNNAIKYAQATIISVKVSQINNKLQVEITDNGKGFNKAQATLGNGLNNMKKRAQEIDGELTIVSKEEIGTTIKLLL